MNLLGLSVILGVACALGDAKRNGVIVTTPRVLLLGSSEKLCLSFHGFTTQETVGLQFAVANSDKTNVYYNTTSNPDQIYLSTSSNAPQCVSFTLPSNLTVKTATLYVDIVSEDTNYTFSGSEEVTLKRPSLIPIIQTDKPMYKPGQTIRFRILVIDDFLKTKLQNIAKIIVEDPLGIRMMQWMNVSVTDSTLIGIADLEMPLSTEPVQGTWKIVVWPAEGDLGVEYKTEKTVKVEEYVLPKYEITLQPPPYVGLLMNTTQATVCAKYTYGEPVKGRLDFSACFTFHSYRHSKRIMDRCFKPAQQDITGCVTVEIPLHDMNLTSREYPIYSTKLEISANVTENATGVVLSESSDSTELTESLFKLDFKPYSHDSYKPNLPYFGKVLVTYPDGTPVAGETVKISYKNPDDNSRYVVEEASDSHGHVTYQLPKLGRSDSAIQVTADMPKYVFSYDSKFYNPSTPKAYHSIKEWYSPSSSYLQVAPVYESVECDQDLILNVSHTVDPGVDSMTIFYQILAQGNIVGDGSSLRQITPELLKFFTNPEICSEDQVFTACGSSCQPTCDDPEPLCTMNCVPRCQCPTEKPLFHKGKCVEASECPEKCTGGQFFETCHTDCPFTCETGLGDCPWGCKEGCYCPRSRPVWWNGTCVKFTECPAFTVKSDNYVRMEEEFMLRYELSSSEASAIADAESPFLIELGFQARARQGTLMQLINEDTGAELSLKLSVVDGLQLLLKKNSELEQLELDHSPVHLNKKYVVQLNFSTVFPYLDCKVNGRNAQYTQGGLDLRDEPPRAFTHVYFGRFESSTEGLQGCIFNAKIQNIEPLKILQQDPTSSRVTLTPSQEFQDSIASGEMCDPEATSPPPAPTTPGTTTTTTAIPELEEKSIIALPMNVRITKDMSPLAHLIVYFVQPNGEVVADSLDIKIKSCLKNQVELNFADESNLPGVAAPLHLEAAPGSVCSLHVLDKSVKLHGGDDRLDVNKVVNYLRANDIPASPSSDYDYCRGKMGDDNDNDYMPWGRPRPGQPWDRVKRSAPRTMRTFPWYRPVSTDWYDFDRQCQANQEFNTCGSPCTRTCAWDGSCPAVCRARCECPRELPIWHGGQCVRKADCPAVRPWRGKTRVLHDPNTVPRSKRSIYYPGGRYYSDYFDSSHAFNKVAVLIMSDLRLMTRPCRPPRRYPTVYYSAILSATARPWHTATFGTSTTTTTPSPEDTVLEDDVDAPAFTPAVDVRTFFPETWLWDLIPVGPSGRVDLTPTLPHTVTEWLGSAFCSNVDQGLGVSDETAIKGFQPFFLSLTLPYSVIKGEQLKLPVTVFNYLSECLVVRMTLQSSNDIEVTGDSTAEMCVCGQQSATNYYRVTFRTVGDVNITVMAETVNNNGICGNDVFLSSQIGVRDAISQPLLVEPSGRMETYTKSEFICLQDGAEKSVEYQLDVPLQDLVPDTARATFQVMGDVMGPALSGLDDLVRLPTGCGEQNMINFAPNIFVLQYLNETQQTSAAIKEKALKYMQTGYQRELTYRHNDGSFSAFGKRDDSGSMWLTAFVVKSFAQASDFIFIDAQDLQLSVDWMIRNQQENGCFRQVGRVIHQEMMGGISGGQNSTSTSLTAYVLGAILEAREHITVPDSVVELGFTCLHQTQQTPSVYTTALMTYAYSLHNPTSMDARAAMQKLDNMASTDGGGKHWGVSAVPTGGHGDRNGAMNVEMTAYGLLAVCQMYGHNAITQALPIVRWLTAQRNGNGGFSSTQDTILALQGLARYAAMAYSAGSDVRVDAVVDGQQDRQYRLHVHEDNKLVLQQYQIQVPSTLRIRAAGSGCVLVQADVRYNVEQIQKPAPEFELRTIVQRVRDGKEPCKRRRLSVCAKYTGSGQASNMVVIGVKMVSGYIPTKASVKELMLDPVLNVKRYEISPNLVELYFDEFLSNLEKCLEFEVEEFVQVDDSQPGMVKIFDYYQPETLVTNAYSIKRICGTKQELPFVTQEEFDKAHNTSGFVPQMRQPERFPDDLFNNGRGINEEWRGVDEPEILPEVDHPLGGGHEEPVDEPLIVPEVAQPLGPGDVELRQSLLCPVCYIELPDLATLQQLFCEAAHVYKAHLRPFTKKYPMRLVHDWRPQPRANPGINAEVELDIVCRCPIVENASTHEKALVFTPEGFLEVEDNNKKGKILLKKGVTVVPFKATTIEERNMRRGLLRGC